jgi:hypothetical protein
MRHLLQIFLEAPHFFHASGLVVGLLSWAIMVAGLFTGPVKVGFASVLGIHTMMFALLGSCFGLTLWSIGLLLSVRLRSPLWPYRFVLEMGEGRLFWAALLFLAVSFGFFVAIFVHWAANGFENLALQKETLLLTAFGANGILLVSNLITAHLLKQMAERSSPR